MTFVNQMLYFFLLLSLPASPACVLWIDHAPIPRDYLAPVCPALLGWEWYDLRLLDDHGDLLCTWPAKNGLTAPPCQPVPSNNYHIEVWLNQPVQVCNLWVQEPAYSERDLLAQCPNWLDEYREGTLSIQGPYAINPPAAAAAACTLPQVSNSTTIATQSDYKFLEGRLNWWGVGVSAWDWQNRFDESIRGAADAAGVPAALLKGMIAQESQFWPLWNGDAGEVGWMQVTWIGTETALRHDPELFARYCQHALWGSTCAGYDLLSSAQQTAVQTELIKSLQVEGTPLQAAAMASEDLWTYAHILRAFACQAAAIYPTRDVWESAAVLYNAGTKCIVGDVVCKQGSDYLSQVNK